MLRPASGYDALMLIRPNRGLFLAAVLLCTAIAALPENAGMPSLSAAEIVNQIQLHNQSRKEGLKQYKTLRHYDVVYKGFSTTVTAKMDVEVSYDASTGKTFTIVSQSGSNFLCDKVLKRAVDSEKEAAQDKSLTALSEANYRFTLLGNDSVAGRPAYIFNVDPRSEGKFLYRGKIWVDAVDFAVVKMDTEPAKNPSFFISRTLIHSTSARDDGFWLPESTRSETKVRIGGTAVLTIDYGKYQIVPSTALAASL